MARVWDLPSAVFDWFRAITEQRVSMFAFSPCPASSLIHHPHARVFFNFCRHISRRIISQTISRDAAARSTKVRGEIVHKTTTAGQRETEKHNCNREGPIMAYTSVDEIPGIVDGLRETYNSGTTR